MKLSVGYKEIEEKVKDLAKVGIGLSKESDKTLKIRYNSGIPLLPTVELALYVKEVYSQGLVLTYSCKPLMEFAVEKLLPKLLERLQDDIVVLRGKDICVNLANIERIEKVFEHLSLSDIEINQEDISIYADVK